MKGLLIKDFYSIVSQLKLFLIIIIAFALVPGYSVSAFAMVYAALLPINALAWDEQSKWDNLARMMPYSKFDLVFSKYIIGYISILAAAVLCTGFAFVYSFFPSSEPLNISSIVMFACSGALLVKGYYSAGLSTLRNALKKELPLHDLLLKERYPTISGHVTVARYTSSIQEADRFLKTLEGFKSINFGQFTTSSLDLVVHDWYNHNSRLISKMSLRS